MNILENKQLKYEQLAFPAWKRVGGVDFNIEQGKNHEGHTKISSIKHWKNQGVKIYHMSKADKDLDDLYYNPYVDELEAINNRPYGTNEKYVLQGEVLFGTGYIIEIPDNVTLVDPLVLEYSVTEEYSSLIDHTFIKIGKNSKATVVVKYTSLGLTSPGYHNGLTKIYADTGSEFQLTKIQTFGEEVNHIDNNVSLIEKDGHVTFTSFDFGAAKVVTDYSAFLVGEGSKNTTVTAYLGDHNRKLDIGYNSIHSGRRSESLIECRGALLDSAKKIFRGNLKFERGAKKSVGKESEFVLLLDEKVHSDAIPALLCDEDDVIGEHAASAGQVDEQQLFYLMSRGFSLKEAKKLVIHGSFSAVIDLLPTDDLKDLVEEQLERRLLNA